jgi:hypothetical protein
VQTPQLLDRIIGWIIACGALDDEYGANMAKLKVLVDPFCWKDDEMRTKGRRFLYRLRCEIIIMREHCTPFKTACYNLEGGYIAGFLAFEEINGIHEWLQIHIASSHNIGCIQAMINMHHADDEEEAVEMQRVAGSSLAVAYDYFNDHFYRNADLYRCMKVFRCLRISNPIYANTLLNTYAHCRRYPY